MVYTKEIKSKRLILREATENDNKIDGPINIRWNLNEAMLNFEGNIGYGIKNK